MKLHWGNAIVIFFAIFLSLATVFIIFSLKQNNDLADEDYYEKGAAYSKQIEVTKRSAIYSDSITIQQNESFVEIEFATTLSDKTKQVNIHLYRPSNKTNDLHLEATNLSDAFQIKKTSLVNGRYIVKFTWQINQFEFGIDKSFFVEK